MKRRSSTLLAGICALGMATQAKAISITLEPTPQTIGVGGVASFNLVVSGLGDFVSPSLGGFDFDLTYDPAVLSPSAVVFGSYLNLGLWGSWQDWYVSSPGTLHVEELSFESATDLNNAQPSSFTLATLSFTGLVPGLSDISFVYGSLAAEECCGSPAFVSSDGSLTVLGSSPVPETVSTASLLGLALLGLWALKSRLAQLAR